MEFGGSRRGIWRLVPVARTRPGGQSPEFLAALRLGDDLGAVLPLAPVRLRCGREHHGSAYHLFGQESA